MGTGMQRWVDPYAPRRVAEFLGLVNVGALRRSPADGRVQVREPGTEHWGRRDDLALDVAAVKAHAHRWVEHDDAGVYRLTERGHGAHEQANPDDHVLFGATAATHRPDPVGERALAPVMTVPAPEVAIRRSVPLLTFAPTAPGPSWMLDVAGLDYLDLRRLLSVPQRAELRAAMVSVLRALDDAGTSS